MGFEPAFRMAAGGYSAICSDIDSAIRTIIRNRLPGQLAALETQRGVANVRVSSGHHETHSRRATWRQVQSHLTDVSTRQQQLVACAIDEGPVNCMQSRLWCCLPEHFRRHPAKNEQQKSP